MILISNILAVKGWTLTIERTVCRDTIYPSPRRNQCCTVYLFFCYVTAQLMQCAAFNRTFYFSCVTAWTAGFLIQHHLSQALYKCLTFVSLLGVVLTLLIRTQHHLNACPPARPCLRDDVSIKLVRGAMNKVLQSFLRLENSVHNVFDYLMKRRALLLLKNKILLQHW